MQLHGIRRDYEQAQLRREDLTDSPFEMLQQWLQQATEQNASPDPTAMVIATVDADQRPRQRTVLLKDLSTSGLVFYTNLHSAKGQALAHNPALSAHFSWLPLERQVAVEGVAKLLPREQVARYFHSRPRESQIGAWVSAQSQVIDSREALEQALQDFQAKFEGGQVPLPEHWGGYLIEPTRFEFWQGGKHRLHDRFEYLKTDNGWRIQRLQP